MFWCRAYHRERGRTIGLWSYADGPLVPYTWNSKMGRKRPPPRSLNQPPRTRRRHPSPDPSCLGPAGRLAASGGSIGRWKRLFNFPILAYARAKSGEESEEIVIIGELFLYASLSLIAGLLLTWLCFSIKTHFKTTTHYDALRLPLYIFAGFGNVSLAAAARCLYVGINRLEKRPRSWRRLSRLDDDRRNS